MDKLDPEYKRQSDCEDKKLWALGYSKSSIVTSSIWRSSLSPHCDSPPVEDDSSSVGSSESLSMTFGILMFLILLFGDAYQEKHTEYLTTKGC